MSDSRNVAGNPGSDDLGSRLALDLQLSETAARKSFLGYLDSVVIDSRPQARKFGPNCDPWQMERARDIAPAIEYVAGIGPMPEACRHFWVMPRGHDKTTSIGRALNYLLAFSRRPFRASVAAADKDQAGLITESMKIEARLNPWLTRKITFGHGRVTGDKGRLDVHSSDVAGSWGLNEDLYVLDEITWWKNDNLWKPLLSAFAKRKGVVVLIISNAGEIGSWQEGIWKEAQTSPFWKTWSAPEHQCLASWIPRDLREADRKMMPAIMGRRVFDNVWIDPAEVGGYLTLKDVTACEDSSLPMFVSAPQRGMSYVASIDYGPKRDRTVLALGHLDEEGGRVIVDRLDVWQGSPLLPVPIVDVERWIEEVAKTYRADIVCDPYQLEGTVQKYAGRHRIERFEARGGKSNYELAECLRSLVVNRQIAWHPTSGRLGLPDGTVETFAQELSRLIIKPTMYGYRVDHLSGRHDDRAVAVGMLALTLLRDPVRGTWVAPQKVNVPDRRGVAKQMPIWHLSIPKNLPSLYGISKSR